MNALSKVVGVVDSNRLIEMATLDLFGMCAFRTWIEWKKRGAEMAGETAIREVMGMICNVFLAGWLSLLMLKLLGSKAGWYNPQGIPAKSWINASSMEAFGTLYRNILQDAKQPPKNPAEARERFVRQVLSGVTSSTQMVRREGLLQSAEMLEGEAKVKYLRALVQDVLPPEAFQKLSKELENDSLQAQAQQLKAAFVQKDQGRLSQAAQDELYQYFALKSPNSASIRGTTPFNALAMAEVRESQEHLETEARRLNRPVHEVLKDFNEAREFQNARFRLSTAAYQGNEELFLNRIQSIGQSSNTVSLYAPNGQKPLLAEIERHTLFGELKHFLEQYVDRANHGIQDYQGGRRAVVDEALFAETNRTGLLAKLFPQLDDGLLRHAVKAKVAYTGIPLLGAILVGMSVGFYNNWRSQKRNGGKMSYPGDGVPAGSFNASGPVPQSYLGSDASSDRPVSDGMALQNIIGHATSLQGRPNGAFAQIQSQRFQHGGVLA